MTLFFYLELMLDLQQATDLFLFLYLSLFLSLLICLVSERYNGCLLSLGIGIFKHGVIELFKGGVTLGEL